MKKTFYFNTGVRPERHNPPVKLSKGQVLRGTIQIPFECENVPDGAEFKFAADDPSIAPYYLAAKIVSGEIVSKYAFFQLPLAKE